MALNSQQGWNASQRTADVVPSGSFFRQWLSATIATAVLAACLVTPGFAQNGAPPEGASCVVSAGNRNAPLAADGSYTVFGIPGNLGAIRARATCSDGSVGQSAIGFTNPFQPATIPLGPIVFGSIDPVPVAVTLAAPNRYLTTGQTSQLTATAVGLNGAVYDVTPRSQGTVYSISNELLATVSDDGLVRIYPEFAPGASSRVVVSSISEGGVASSYMYVLGPRGSLSGTVVASDGTTPVAGAEVSVLRIQPMEQAGTAITNASGQFHLDGVNAGNFVVSAIEPSTRDRALGYSRIATEGENAQINLRLNGLGTVEVTVLDAVDQPVPATEVTFTALGAYQDVRALATGANGKVGFANVAAGDFTVSARQPATRLIGTAVAQVNAGAFLPITLKLQPIGEIRGRVFAVDGTTPRAGVQVRIISRQRGILTQTLSAADGSYAFDTLPLSDGPFTLDAFVDGRLRARLPGNVIAQPNEILTRNIVLAPSGSVRGEVRRGGVALANTEVRLQSLEGLRLSFEGRTDGQGRFRFLAVPVGDFELLATAPNGQTGRSLSRVSTDAQEVTQDVVIADDTLAGTVYQRDGLTPVGAGVTVYLARRSLGSRYTYANALSTERVLSTETDASGRFGFVVAETGAYYVQAEQDLERGRSEATVVNLNPAQPLEARVVFLAKGSVRGQVRDIAGTVQADVPVTVRSEGAFTLDRTVRTGPDGRYSVEGVFVGDLVVVARNETTQLTGISQGRLNAEGEQAVLDVTLAATAQVSGVVRKRNGGSATGPIRVTLRRDGATVTTQEFPGTSYVFPTAPVGQIEIDAVEITTGDRGIATTRVAGSGDNRTLDVSLVGQGRIDVQLLDSNGQPVVGAKVQASNRVPFNLLREGLSDANGRISFQAMYVGDYSISASKPLPLGTMSGSATGTLLYLTNDSVTITMQTLVIGVVEGQLLQPDAVTPAGPGMVIRMQPEPFRDAFVTVTDAEGRYRFESVPAGSYTVDALRFYNPLACPDRDRVRARAAGVQVQNQGQVVTANLILIGEGQVRGRVERGDGSPAAGVRVTLTNPDPAYGANVTCSNGTVYSRTTDSNGDYWFEDVPPGDFTLDATTANGGLMAEGSGRVRFNGDIVVVNLALIDSAITLPKTLHDANGFAFDVQGHGGIGTGTNSVFQGTAPNTAGMRLEIVRNGVAVPFVNGDGTIGRLARNGQQVEVDDSTASGLFVRREVFVPRAGYFARYLEVLRNPSNEPITVDVLIKSHHRPAQANPRVVDSSDGDQILNVAAGAGRDRWVVIDDQQDSDPFSSSSIPATVHVFDGEGGAAQVAAASYELIGQTGRLSYRWNGITVPAGGEVRLLHFAMNQIDRFSARAAALRVSSLPPEMLEDLTTAERQSVLNFALPETSSVAALPNLDAGRVYGRVFSGDGLTVVPNAVVRFKSKHPLFGRVRFKTTDANGQFEFRSTLDGSVNNYVIPVFGFDLSASYSLSRANSALTPGDFEAEQTSEQQDLVFIGQGDVRGLVKRHNQSALAAATVRLCRLPSRSTCTDTEPNPSNQAQSAADGRYLLLANPPRDYFLFAHKSHPQVPRSGIARPILGEGQVTVTAGDTSVADVIMEQTGSIAGQVRATNGTPVVGAFVEISPSPGPFSPIRGTTTDTFGNYRLFDVPLGTYAVRAEDESSNAYGSAEATVTVDTEQTADVVLRPFGLVRIQVNYARGIPASLSRVTLGSISSGTTDTNGRINLQAPEGSHTITAQHPDRFHGELLGTATAVIASPGEQVDVVVTLGPAGAVFGTIVRPDASTLADGFPYSIRRLSGGQALNISSSTSQTGAFRQNGLPMGQYLLTAYDAAQDRYIDAEFALSADGEEVGLNLVLLENRIALPADLRDANRFRFDVQHSGALAQGSGNFANAGAKLTVNGVAYTGETSARLEADRRQFLIAQAAPMAGLKVSRRIYVPRGAYFARYLEILENQGTEPRVVDVALRHQMSAGDVLATSSGDALVDPSDHWISMDDEVDEDILLANGQIAPTAFVFSANGGALQPDQVSLASNANRPEITARWSALTVPAGGRVVLMHFVVQQIKRSGLSAAVSRLAQLPPEVLTDLGTEDRSSIGNFVLPALGSSNMAALPALTASVSGIVYEGDARTPVRNVRVSVQSTHPLFNRVWGLHRDPIGLCPPGTPVGSLVSIANVPPNQQNPPPLGRYSLAGQLTETDSIALPEGVPVRLTAQEPRGCFSYYAGHSWTGVPSRVETPSPSATQNLIFDTGVLTGTARGAADYSITSGRMYLSTDDPDPLAYRYIPIAADGTWTYPGLLPGTYDVIFDARHPNATGSDVLRGHVPAAQVNLAQIRVQDIDLQPTGRIQGAVVSATGEQSVAARVILTGAAADQSYDQCATGCVPETLAKHIGKRAVTREVLTDSLGRYQLGAVPVGQYTLTVIDPISDGRSTRTLTVTDNQTTVQNVTLLPLGRAEVTVLSRNGQPVVDAYVYLYADAQGFEKVVGRTDFLGRLTVANIAAGNYRLRVTDPRNVNLRYLDRTVTGTITLQGQVDNQPVTMLAVSQLAITVTNGPIGSPGIAGAQVRLSDTRGTQYLGTTNAQGQINASFVPEGTAMVSASAQISGLMREGQVPVVIGPAQDGQTLNIAVNLADAQVPLPQTLIDANRSTYQIDNDAAGYLLPMLRVAGTPFIGANAAAQQLQSRQFVVAQAAPVAGLQVTRKVYVPRNGYFARYLEVLQNESSSDITTDVEIRTQLQYNEYLYESSSGDNVAGNDLWLTWTQSSPEYSLTSAALFADQGARAPVLDQIEENGERYLRARWLNVQIPAGGRRTLMHFLSRQYGHSAARDSVLRLQQLPAEATEGLLVEPPASIQNFAVPADLSSAVPALPSLLGRITGVLRESDGSPVANAFVRVRSRHPLFVREWSSASASSLRTNALGEFSLTGVLNDLGNNFPLPLDAAVSFTVAHPQVAATVVNVDGNFVSDLLHQEISFNAAVLQGTVSGAFQYPTYSGFVELVSRASTAMASDGSYRMGGLPIGTWNVRATLSLPDGDDLSTTVNNVSLVAGPAQTLNIVLPPNGAVRGVVRSAAGQVLAGATVRLQVPGMTRTMQTNANGEYAFNAALVGTGTVQVTDPRSQALTTEPVTITANQETVLNFDLPAVGTLNISLQYARGVAASGVRVYLSAPSIQGQRDLGTTNAAGMLSVTAPVGSLTVRANHPLSGESVTLNSSLDVDGGVRDLNLILPASARVQATVLVNGIAMPGATVLVRAAEGATTLLWSGPTDTLGQYRTGWLRSGRVQVLALAPVGAATAPVAINADVDGQTVNLEMNLDQPQQSSGVLAFDGERHLHGVNLNAGDVFSLSAFGADHANASAICAVRVTVYSPTGTRLAEGIGNGPSSYGQTNVIGDLRNIPVTTSGLHLILIRREYNYCQTGAYRVLGYNQNGPVSISRDVGGGRVEGRVLRNDGISPIANALVRLRTSDVYFAYEQVRTNAQGQFVFPSVRPGSFELSHWTDAPSEQVVTVNGTVQQAGDVVIQDLVLPPVTTVNVTVQQGGAPLNAAFVRFTSPTVYSTRYTDTQGRASLAYRGAAELNVFAQHPLYSSVQAQATVTPADGQVREVLLDLSDGSVSGVVRDQSGTPLSGISVEAILGNNYLAFVQTDSNGAYTFPRLAAGSQVQILARDPMNGAQVETLVTPVAGSNVTADLVLPGRGSVALSVVNQSGQALRYVTSFATFETVIGSGSYTTYAYGSTDMNGERLIEFLPVGRPIRITAEYYGNGGGERPDDEQPDGGGGGLISAETTITLNSSGEVLPVQLVINIPQSARLLANITAADSQPINWYCELSLEPSEVGGISGPCDDELIIDNVPPGSYQARLRINGNDVFTETVTINEGQDTNFAPVLSVVRGLVTHPEGGVVANGWVDLRNSLDLNDYTQTDDLGHYRFVAVPVGAFSVQVGDNASNLTTSANGNVSSASALVDLNVVMPASGTVRGSVRDANGTLLPQAFVSLREISTGGGRGIDADGVGNYSLTRVELGGFEIAAIKPDSGLFVTATGTLSSHDQEVVVDLNLPTPGSISGTLRDSGGVTMPAHCVDLRSQGVGAGHDDLLARAQTDANGVFAFPEVAAGEFIVSAYVCNQPDAGAQSLAVVNAGQLTEVNLTWGSALRLPRDFVDPISGFTQSINPDGSLSTWRMPDWRNYAFNMAPALAISEPGRSLRWYPWREMATALDAGRTLDLPPMRSGSLLITRRLHVPAAGGYVRVLESVTNLSASTVSPELWIEGEHVDADLLRPTPPALLNRYAVQSSSALSSYSPAATAYVFAGPGADLAASVDFAPGQNHFKYGWTPMIAAGQTVSLLHYLLVADPAEAASLETRASALSTLSVPSMFDGLSAAERARIVNFEVPAP